MPNPEQPRIHESAVRRVLSGELVPSPLSGESIIRLLKHGGLREEQNTRSVLQEVDSRERGSHGLPIALDNLRRIQRGLKSQDVRKLESLAEKLVREHFAIPDEISMQAHLMPDVGSFRKNISSESASNDPEVNKRRTINAIMQGGASAFQYLFLMETEKLESIAPGLSQSSRKLMAAGDRAVWEIDERRLDFRNLPAGGVVELTFDGGELSIIARATEFPLLIHELAKGALEALALHGLPKEDAYRARVLNAADRANYEPWDLRIGKGLWRVLNDHLPSDPLKRSRALKAIFELPADIFNKAITELVDGRPELIQAAVRNARSSR